MRRISINTLAVMFYDLFVILMAFALSIALLNIRTIPPTSALRIERFELYTIILLVQFFCFYGLGLYKAVIRFSSIPDMIRIIRGVTLAVPLSYLAAASINHFNDMPRSIFIIDWFLLLIGLSAGRLAYRIAKDSALEKVKAESHDSYKRTFIVGAGVTGERLLREISLNPGLPLKVIGFVDDNKVKIGRSIRGVNVFGPINKLPELLVEHGIQHLILAMPSADQEQIRQISQLARQPDQEIDIKILPKMSDVIAGKLSLKALRNIEPEDLLGRKAHNLDIQKMSEMLKGKVILITGAGGSIGSELCQQIAKFQPKLLILLELTELFLYELEHSLKDKFPGVQFQSIIGDVRNLKKLSHVFDTYHPEVVFHAAAYKHVPLMELNPLESIHTNVLGTYNIALLSAKHHVDRFVLISTDKAINPTNIMGATKRVAELICQYIQASSPTKFVIVRFGNVLGSSGSVIPLFKRQIEKGGPVTVTHPEMRRYFMSIPEATQLVIQAGSIGNGGEVMVLDMGEAMKIKDLAYEMIALAGHKPDVDIKIEYTGLRPGEKLFEELFHAGETILPTPHPMVKIAKTLLPQENFKENLECLMSLSEGTTEDDIKGAINNLVPEYSYSAIVGERAKVLASKATH